MPNQRLVLCFCSRCSQFAHPDNTLVNKPGLYVDKNTRKAHQLADQRAHVLAQQALEGHEPNDNDHELNEDPDIRPRPRDYAPDHELEGGPSQMIANSDEDLDLPSPHTPTFEKYDTSVPSLSLVRCPSL